MAKHPNLHVKGGDSQTNPYKIPYELVLAEKRELFEKYKNSGNDSLFNLKKCFGLQDSPHGTLKWLFFTLLF